MSDPVTKFEALSSNPSFSHAKGSEPLGRRDNASLSRGFAGSPILSNRYTITNASQVFQEYAGENLQFVEYRRDFKPDGSAGVDYQAVRDKKQTRTGAYGAPATPYTPNIASPIVPERTIFSDYNQLDDVETGLNQTQKSRISNDSSLNPRTFVNSDSYGQSTNVGQVRRFRLGIGSVKTIQ
jgi:hypothetical protein